MVIACFAAPVLAQPAQPQASAKALALVDTIGIENIMTPAMHEVLKPFMVPLQQANKGREQEVFQVFDSTVMKQARLAMNAKVTKQAVAQLYGRLFTEQELEDLTKFFASPLGRKFAAQNARIADAMPILAVKLLGSATMQMGLQAGIAELEGRGMTIPPPPTSN